MMGRLKSDQGQLFYRVSSCRGGPEDHLARKIDAALDPSWLRGELAAHYSSMGRPLIDPELMIRMLIVGYVFAMRSERLICRKVQVNLPIAASASSVPLPPVYGSPCWRLFGRLDRNQRPIAFTKTPSPSRPRSGAD